MKIVIDTNILLSALLNAQGKIGDLLFNSSQIFEFYSVNILKEELVKHEDKLLSISGFIREELMERKTLVYKQIKFIDDFLLPESLLRSSEEILKRVDVDDTLHVALASHLKPNCGLVIRN